MPRTVLGTLHAWPNLSSNRPYEIGTIIIAIYRGKRHRAVKWHSQGHTDRKWWTQDANPGGLAPEAVLYLLCPTAFFLWILWMRWPRSPLWLGRVEAGPTDCKGRLASPARLNEFPHVGCGYSPTLWDGSLGLALSLWPKVRVNSLSPFSVSYLPSQSATPWTPCECPTYTYIPLPTLRVFLWSPYCLLAPEQNYFSPWNYLPLIWLWHI